jgi:hypothetical protein
MQGLGQPALGWPGIEQQRHNEEDMKQIKFGTSNGQDRKSTV